MSTIASDEDRKVCRCETASDNGAQEEKKEGKRVKKMRLPYEGRTKTGKREVNYELRNSECACPLGSARATC